MRINKTLTIAAGTPVNLAVALGLVQAVTAATTPIWANRVFAQMLAGGTGLGYVMDLDAFAAGTQAAVATNGHLTAQLAPATATAPGGAYGDAVAGVGQGGLVDVTKFWIDGAHSGDTVVTSVNLRI
jgi:hypothetical protein